MNNEKLNSELDNLLNNTILLTDDDLKHETHMKKIGNSLRNKPKSDSHKKKIKNTGNLFGDKDAWNKGKNGYKTKPHSEETKLKMRNSAIGKIISQSQRNKVSKILSIPIIATNLKTGKIKQYSSTKEAKEKLGLNGILHVLKGRTKQCGGYYFEYKK